ncbi:CU044_2847 family protein [Streptomyces sp. NPDC006999]|uniref:CU044_2847 family protein n=1 Tax=Streptomyces sp. NPDC006999 TaxID=3156909 RepID=UPI0033EBD7D4
MPVIEFPAGADGSEVYVVVDAQGDSWSDEEEGDGLVPASAGGSRGRFRAQRPGQRWEDALAPLGPITSAVLAQVQQARPLPAEVEVTFQVAFTGEGNLTLVKFNAASHVQVKAVWRAGDAIPAGPGGGEGADA